MSEINRHSREELDKSKSGSLMFSNRKSKEKLDVRLIINKYNDLENQRLNSQYSIKKKEP